MKRGFNLGQGDFDALLDLLSKNREEAGDLYEKLRSGLRRFFYYKGCSDPEGLADETFNRVATRVHKFNSSSNARLESHFYGFAKRVALEDKRRAALQSPLDDAAMNGRFTVTETEDEEESEIDDLQDCLNELSLKERQLVLEYYSEESAGKSRVRDMMCERLNCSSSALYTRVFRIKQRLKDCLEERKRK